MEVHEHKHPLCLVDLQPNYPHYEEEFDDETGELITKDEHQGRCNWCKKDIMFFHRYYYKCAHPDPSCNYLLHMFCKELPTTLKHASHTNHTLKLFQWENYEWSCRICGSDPKNDALSYHCSKCHFDIHVKCGMAVAWAKDRIIYHPSHQHPLVATPKPISCECNACGKDAKPGIFYLCTTCAGYFIHTDCVHMPKTLVIKLNGVSTHIHPLTLSYSFPRAYQKARFDPPCRMCNKSFHDENLWIYKCEKCRYYVHFACSKMASVSDDENRHLLKEFPYPYDTIVHLPFIDETLNVLKNLFFKQNGNQTFEDNLKHNCHQHPLHLVHTKSTSSRSDMLLSCHDPIKKIELLCNGCLRPITSKPFYKCASECNFVLHEWCTQLPATVEHHMGHLQHTLTLHPSPDNKFFPVFVCAVCKLPCNGFVYSCVKCDYHIDVNCAFIPEMIKHEAHPHVLMLVDFSSSHNDFPFESCCLCLNETTGYMMSFYCFFCHAFLHVKCAFLLPGKIKHKYDKHPMNLSYLPIENHKGDYFCEICEDELNPQHCFYHCSQPHCNQSIHSSCAPFILESETATSTKHVGVYEYVNIKFGDIHSFKDHTHNLKFVLGTDKDGRCTKCNRKLSYNMIFKCLQCKFAIDFKCCERLSSG